MYSGTEYVTKQMNNAVTPKQSVSKQSFVLLQEKKTTS